MGLANAKPCPLLAKIKNNAAYFLGAFLFSYPLVKFIFPNQKVLVLFGAWENFSLLWQIGILLAIATGALLKGLYENARKE